MSTLAAELFSEPPMNLLPGRVSQRNVTFGENTRHSLTRELERLPEGEYLFGVRPSHVGLAPESDDDLKMDMRVELGEISGSETFLHVRNDTVDMVVQELGVHAHHQGDSVRVYLPMNRLFVFDRQQALVHTPADTGGLDG